MMKNRNLFEFVLGCVFLIIPLIHILFWIVTYIKFFLIGERSSILGLSVDTAIAVAGFSLAGALLIIHSNKK